MDVDPSAMTEAGAAAGAATDLDPGVLVGKYRLDRVLGSGGMGVVWAAFDPDLERPVAIKVLRSIDSVAALRTRLLREARAMARLKHPNVLTVYEVGTDRNRDYIAMELVDGADLDGWLATQPPRAEIFAALFAAGRGLAAAHDAGLIHRDLKPHNILRGRDGGVYVTDFGLARGQIDDGAEVVQGSIGLAATAVPLGSHARAIDSVLDSPLTQTGVLIGTPAYMAPEQFAGRAPDPRSDQFAFCVTAWEALTGSRPFVGKTLDELRVAVSTGAHAIGEMPPRIRQVLLRGLAPDPDARWPDMYALLRALEMSIVPPRRSRMPLVLAATALATVGVVTGVALYSRSHASHSRADCTSPVEAFGAAWSAERRKIVVARHKSDVQSMIAVASLDELRNQWIRRYEAACAMPPSSARHEQLACLFDARDEINETTHELASDRDEMTLAGVLPLNIAMEMCGRR
jgi:serine/threonine protein kinase